VAAARHHFKISVDFCIFKNRRHLEMGPAAVRKTLAPIIEDDIKNIDSRFFDVLFRQTSSTKTF
jgi:hypothetical protein